jgi:GT2 family glycosyltransferase
MKHAESKILDDAFVSIIILNYNGGNLLLECIESVYNTTGCKYEVILIDNCSSDNSHIVCKEKFPQIILIQNDKNIGMSARNIGLKTAHGNFVVFLDSDTEVESNWLVNFIKSFELHREGLYQPKFLKKEQHSVIDSAGNMINIFGLAYARGKGDTDVGQYNTFHTINYTAGACIFSSLTTIQKIGEIDDIFFAYHDDVDYGWRGSLLGIPSYYEPNVVVYHQSSPTMKWSSKKFFLLERNRWICLLTLYSRKTLIKIFPLLILVEIGMFLFFLRSGMGFAKIKSCFSLIKMRKDINKRRAKIAQNRKFDDKTIIKNFVDDFWLPSYKIDQRTSKLVNSLMVSLNRQARNLINI